MVNPLYFSQLDVKTALAMATPLKRKAGDIATSTAKKPKANASITSFFSSPSSTAKPAAAAAASTASSTVPSSPATVADDASQRSTTSTTATTTASIFTSAAAAPSSAESAAPLPKFDKAKWVEKLTPEQKDLLALEIASLDESWLAHLKDEVVTKDFLDLKRFLKKEHDSGKKIFPPAADVYSWYDSAIYILPFCHIMWVNAASRSRHTPLNTVKCVILGQDPYHGPNQAHGLCFSVPPPPP